MPGYYQVLQGVVNVLNLNLVCWIINSPLSLPCLEEVVSVIGEERHYASGRGFSFMRCQAKLEMVDTELLIFEDEYNVGINRHYHKSFNDLLLNYLFFLGLFFQNYLRRSRLLTSEHCNIASWS